MTYEFHTERFTLEYAESTIDSSVLWETHCHARYEMIAVLEGDVSIALEGQSYRLTERQSVIIPPLIYHTITANKRGAYRRVTALFDIDSIPDVLRPRLTGAPSEFSMIYSPEAEDMRQICIDRDTEFYAPLADSLLVRLLYRHAQAEQANADGQTDEFLQKIISYVNEHICEKILLDDLVRHTSRSKSSVCHLFEQRMNVSPKQYILQKKMAYAAKLIRDGTPPTLASIRVGYDNYSDFYRMYHKHFGTSPTKE